MQQRPSGLKIQDCPTWSTYAPCCNPAVQTTFISYRYCLPHHQLPWWQHLIINNYGSFVAPGIRKSIRQAAPGKHGS